MLGKIPQPRTRRRPRTRTRYSLIIFFILASNHTRLEGLMKQIVDVIDAACYPRSNGNPFII